MSSKIKLKNMPVQDRVFTIINTVLLTIFLICILYPLWFILIASISNPNLVSSGKVLFYPKELTLSGYKKVFEYKEVWVGFKNSVIYTIVYTVIATYLTLVGGYFLSRKDVIFRKTITSLLVFTMFFGGGLIPTYLVVYRLGITDTMWALILPAALSVYNMMIAKSFFQNNIPNELFDAAKIDGASNIRYFFSMVIPLSVTLIAVIALFNAVAEWNAYFQALIYIRSKDKQPLQIILRNILVMNTIDTGMIADAASMDERQRIADLLKYVLIIVASIPMFIIYPFAQKYFVKGVMMGSVKG